MKNKDLLKTYSMADSLVSILLRKTMPKKTRIQAADSLRQHLYLAIRGYYLLGDFINEKSLVDEFKEWQKPKLKELEEEIKANAKII